MQIESGLLLFESFDKLLVFFFSEIPCPVNPIFESSKLDLELVEDVFIQNDVFEETACTLKLACLSHASSPNDLFFFSSVPFLEMYLFHETIVLLQLILHGRLGFEPL
jgi:hypothetical protein